MKAIALPWQSPRHWPLVSPMHQCNVAHSFLIGDGHLVDSNVPFYYYKYLHVADMRHLSAAQVRALELEGCFQVPSGAAWEEVMRQYFLHVHPCLPLLNEGQFWDMCDNRGPDGNGSPTFSLTLFQAMLFAASRVRRRTGKLYQEQILIVHSFSL